MDDVRAVMDAARSERAALFGYSEGGPMAVLFAATYPARTVALVLYASYAKRRDPDDDYPWAPTAEERLAYADEIEQDWSWETDMRRMCPSADEAMARWWARRAHAAASPGAARELLLMNSQIDIRHVLPSVRVPTLVMHRTGDRDSRCEEGRYLAERIPGARFVELAGEDHVPWIDPERILEETEEFLTGSRHAPDPDRVLKTLVFTDIVGSTERAAPSATGAGASFSTGTMPSCAVTSSASEGTEVDTAGDGFFATFDGPARAVRAARAIRDDLRALELEIRAGVHTGECELVAGGVRGIAVHVAARVAAKAAPGEIVVSNTVHDLVAGSGLRFAARGTAELKGIPGEWRLWSVVE